ncbi:hypothetical protein LNO81_30290 [Klebsiella variicola subsp. variicola]|nr:hypothetical protein [Klebsiella variicola subsp. variicola]
MQQKKAIPAPEHLIFSNAVDDIKNIILQISHDVWNNPELSLHEEISSKIHKDALEKGRFYYNKFRDIRYPYRVYS